MWELKWTQHVWTIHLRLLRKTNRKWNRNGLNAGSGLVFESTLAVCIYRILLLLLLLFGVVFFFCFNFSHLYSECMCEWFVFILRDLTVCIVVCTDFAQFVNDQCSFVSCTKKKNWNKISDGRETERWINSSNFFRY